MTTIHICWELARSLCHSVSPSGNEYNRLIFLAPINVFLARGVGGVESLTGVD